jgi:hypothetical protein
MREKNQYNQLITNNDIFDYLKNRKYNISNLRSKDLQHREVSAVACLAAIRNRNRQQNT